MTILVTLRGPEAGTPFPLTRDRTTLGRQVDCGIVLAGKQVSRQHAQILLRDGQCEVEDLGSSNGTYLNGQRLTPRRPAPLTERDELQIGPYFFGLQHEATAPPRPPSDPALVIRETVNATNFNQTLLAPDPASKLRVVLEIAQQLSRTLEIEPLLSKLLEQIMRLLPQADRAMVVLCEGERLVVRAQLGRGRRDMSEYPYSRTIVRRALDEGVGLISDDVLQDQRFQASSTLMSLNLHSVLCVPLINPEGRRLGIIQADRFHTGYGFNVDDLYMLTAIGMQVSVVLENAELHAERIREERLHQEVALARDIQQGYLPDELEGFPDADFEVLGQVFPARQVAGDLYDFLKVPSGRLAFFLGDVSGKGIPAALFMVAVRTLCRHLVKESDQPAQLLNKLHAELGFDNPSCQFVTLAHGLFDPASGEVVLASAGHPPPLLRRKDGSVETIALATGRPLGCLDVPPRIVEVRLTLAPGELLFFYTDGLLEARSALDKSLFGADRIAELTKTFGPDTSLADAAEQTKAAVARFTAASELQDDLTVLLLRRKG
jgi:sigma-B regulation protein RsbU (phosphoserine phosphatase)